MCVRVRVCVCVCVLFCLFKNIFGFGFVVVVFSPPPPPPPTLLLYYIIYLLQIWVVLPVCAVLSGVPKLESMPVFGHFNVSTVVDACDCTGRSY